MDPKEIGFKGLNWIQLNKTVFFILTIVRTWNLTCIQLTG
jgi:hypothetical protein